MISKSKAPTKNMALPQLNPKDFPAKKMLTLQNYVLAQWVSFHANKHWFK